MGGTPSWQVCKQSCMSKQDGRCISSRSRSWFTRFSCSTASLSGLTFQTLSPQRQQRYRQDRLGGYCTHFQNVHAGHPPGLPGDQSRTAHRHHPALRRTLPQHKQRGRRPGRTGQHTPAFPMQSTMHPAILLKVSLKARQWDSCPIFCSLPYFYIYFILYYYYYFEGVLGLGAQCRPAWQSSQAERRRTQCHSMLAGVSPPNCHLRTTLARLWALLRRVGGHYAPADPVMRCSGGAAVVSMLAAAQAACWFKLVVGLTPLLYRGGCQLHPRLHLAGRCHPCIQTEAACWAGVCGHRPRSLGRGPPELLLQGFCPGLPPSPCTPQDFKGWPGGGVQGREQCCPPGGQVPQRRCGSRVPLHSQQLPSDGRGGPVLPCHAASCCPDGQMHVQQQLPAGLMHALSLLTPP